ncbi:bacterial shufflon protein, N-terminal constant region domain protein [Selenomonas sp. FOBRC9]|uniref:gp53-like domain-containing protein n=1 Tax=Selenomonas sp. FOBRC9 TaxID=936573 RepID=UPI00027A632F|nr:shufflon system plasmid conjugative transfer pilus tip adhesin PilV [Selenomonas sp. FOBRC9]EJP32302.1 bacterial shufflon protein, N-terminal constant region domain protein [Selenomonas sp. FOBRC9]
MAKTNFQIFNEENMPERTYNDSEYKEATQRIGGVIPGMALSRMHNKMYYQWSAMCKAIANLIVKRGHDCMDNDVEGITRYLEEAITSAAADGINTHRTAAELDHPEKSVHKKHLHADAYESPALTGTPTAPTASAGTRSDQLATTNFVAAAITALVNSSPAALDTLQELAKAIGNDPNFATTILNNLAEKVSKSGDTMSGALWAATFNTRDWFRAHDDSGFYFESHGGGWHMTDNDWIRAYNGKHVYTSGKMKADEGFEGRLIGKADSADRLGGQSLSDILEKITAQNTGGIVASSIAQNGWVKFANGLIIQWGTIDGLSSAARSYAFPIEFPNKAFMITGGSVSYEYGVGFSLISNTQFIASWWPDDIGTPQNGHPVQFIAIGH